MKIIKAVALIPYFVLIGIFLILVGLINGTIAKQLHKKGIDL